MNLFKQEDTIVALATGNIKSALAIIRISGSIAKVISDTNKDDLIPFFLQKIVTL